MPEKSSFRIEFLADHRQHISVIARWFHEEWLRDSEGWTLEQTIQSVTQNDCFKDRLNVTLIALNERDEPVGVIQLLDTVRLQGWEKCLPWIDGLYIVPEYRNSGIAYALGYRIIQITAELGFENLYAAAFDMKAILKNHHFGAIGETRYGDKTIHIYKKQLM